MTFQFRNQCLFSVIRTHILSHAKAAARHAAMCGSHELPVASCIRNSYHRNTPCLLDADLMMDLMPHSSDFVLRSAVSLADRNIGGWDSAVKRSAGRRSRLWSSRVPRLPKSCSPKKNTCSLVLHYLAFFPIVRHFLAGWLTLGPRPCPVCLHWKDQRWVPNSTEMLLELHLLHLLLPLLVAGDVQPIFNP